MTTGNGPLARASCSKERESLISEMSMFLRTRGVKLDDESAVMLALVAHGYRAGEIVANVDAAITGAKAIPQGVIVGGPA